MCKWLYDDEVGPFFQVSRFGLSNFPFIVCTHSRIASLLNLGKIHCGDIEPIMDKFRTLAKASGGHTGYINVENVPDETDMTFDDDELEEMEGVEGV